MKRVIIIFFLTITLPSFSQEKYVCTYDNDDLIMIFERLGNGKEFKYTNNSEGHGEDYGYYNLYEDKFSLTLIRHISLLLDPGAVRVWFFNKTDKTFSYTYVGFNTSARYHGKFMIIN